MELVDMRDSKSRGASREGSSPSPGTIPKAHRDRSRAGRLRECSTLVMVCSLIVLGTPASARVSYEEAFLCRVGPRGLEQVMLYFAEQPASNDASEPSPRGVTLVDDNAPRGVPRQVLGQAQCARTQTQFDCELSNGQRLSVGIPSDAAVSGYYQLSGKLSKAGDDFNRRASCLIKAR